MILNNHLIRYESNYDSMCNDMRISNFIVWLIFSVRSLFVIDFYYRCLADNINDRIFLAKFQINYVKHINTHHPQAIMGDWIDVTRCKNITLLPHFFKLFGVFHIWFGSLPFTNLIWIFNTLPVTRSTFFFSSVDILFAT